jgi:DNA-binding SARP family transcriptional activator
VDFNPLMFEDRYALNPRFQIQLDAQRLERALERQDSADLQRLVDGYDNEFMLGVDTEWVQEYRTKTGQLILEACALLGEQLTPTEPQRALEAFKRGLELEPLGERCALGLIRAYLRLSNERGAQRAYWQFVARLEAEMGLEPSPSWVRALEALGFDAGSPPIPRSIS